MVGHGLFSIALHTGVYCGVYLESVSIDVVFRTVGLGILFNPTEQRISGPSYGVIDKLLFLPASVF